MQENTHFTNTPGSEPPKKKNGNILFIIMLAFWMIFIFYFGAKGPG